MKNKIKIKFYHGREFETNLVIVITKLGFIRIDQVHLKMDKNEN